MITGSSVLWKRVPFFQRLVENLDFQLGAWLIVRRVMVESPAALVRLAMAPSQGF